MSFILGNQSVLSAFKDASKTGRHSHAYIIEGAEGSGKLTLARAISVILTCPEKEPCFTCAHCRRIMDGVHQDVKELRCLEGDTVITIEAVRDMIADAYIKPAECDKKIFILDGAQKTKTETQNALLQIFEEPPANVVIFLLVPNRNLLLSTLKSRAITLKTEKFSDSFIKEELERRYPEQQNFIEEAAVIADGALGQAIDFMENEEKREAVELIKSFFAIFRQKATYSSLVTTLVSGIKGNREKLFSTMEFFNMALRDIITFSTGYKEKNMFFTDIELLTLLSQRLDVKKLFEVYDLTCRVLRDSTKINPSLALANICTLLANDLS